MILAHTRTSNTRCHAVVCADYLTVLHNYIQVLVTYLGRDVE